MNKYLLNVKSFVLLTIAVVAISGFFVSMETAFATNVVLGVTQITAVKTFASTDNTFENGWSWVFDVTVPTDETNLKMKFADWTGVLGSIPAGNNIRFYSAESSNASDASHAITISSAGIYSDVLNLNSGIDRDAVKAGRQIQITLETRVPVGSAGGSYSTSYGMQSVEDPAIVVAKIKIAADTVAAQTVSDQITALPFVDALVLADKDVVVAVQTAFNALTADQKDLVTNADVLSADISKIADLQSAADVALANATNAVVTAEADPSENNKNTAVLLIIQLPPGPAKTALFARIDELQAAQNASDAAAAAEALTNATDAVVLAETTPTQSSINFAILLTIKLPFGANKTALFERINAIVIIP